MNCPKKIAANLDLAELQALEISSREIKARCVPEWLKHALRRLKNDNLVDEKGRATVFGKEVLGSLR